MTAVMPRWKRCVLEGYQVNQRKWRSPIDLALAVFHRCKHQRSESWGLVG